MLILGQYNPQLQTISIDLPSHLFSGDVPVIFHEVSHYFLSKFTNEGAVYSILCEIRLPPNEFVVNRADIENACKTLYLDMYNPQEGFAHLMQAMKIYDERGGLSAVKEWEDLLPNEPKVALSFVRYALNFNSEQRNNFTAKLSRISLNTGLHGAVIRNHKFLLNHEEFKSYLAVDYNSAGKRFEILCRAVEKDDSLLELEESEICSNVGLNYYEPITNPERAALINAITTFTKTPSSLTEKDISSLDRTEEALHPAYQSLIVRDANIERRAVVNMTKDQIYSEAEYFRTIFIYNNPESPQKENHFGFYSFSKNKLIINNALEIDDRSKSLLQRKEITKVLDTASYDFEHGKIKEERGFVAPDIIWHKNYLDLVPLIQMAERFNLVMHLHHIAFTANHPYRFFIIKIENMGFLHITVGYPFISTKLAEGRFRKIVPDFFELIAEREHHINNFFHDLMGLPYLFNFTEIVRNPEVHLRRATMVAQRGMERNNACICGSEKKYKKCHGF